MRTPILLIFLFGFSIIYDVEAYPAKHEPADNSVYGVQHCIHMTPENEEKISTIVVKLSEYLYNLTIEHEIFDIRLLKIVIERHSDDEVEEKDTKIQLVVNDCDQSDEFADAEQLEDIIGDEDPTEKARTIAVDFIDTEDEHSEDNDINTESDNATDENESEDGAEAQTEVAKNDDSENNVITIDSEESSEAINQTSSENLNQSERYATGNVKVNSGIDVDEIQPSSAANYEVQGPVLVRLDLDKNGNKLIRGTQVKRGEHVPLILYVQKVLGNVEYLFAN